ncbi:zinc finger protein 233-like [Hetaerina americana]|uniref:zinc finger protein 233-like n=1 Tax=Hetaerina americana TaxID=62018 RepID=UPI003A7F61D3
MDKIAIEQQETVPARHRDIDNNVEIQEGTSEKYLKRHILTHTEERPHRCEICSRTFTRNSYLKRHLLTHTGEKIHKCDLCSKSHKCEICSRAFALSFNLKRHLLTHTGEKPYQCEVCSKGFAWNSNLIIHLLTHTGEKRHKVKTSSLSSGGMIHAARLAEHSATNIFPSVGLGAGGRSVTGLAD